MERRSAVAYIRVSGETQSKEDAYGKDVQRAAILDYADREGYVITRWYEEVGCGAEERPILESICFGDEVDNPPVEALIVFKQDRVARDMTLFFMYMFYLKKKNIELVSVNDNVDKDDPMWGIRMALIQMIAEQERKNITLRTSAGKAVKAQNGGFCGGRTPFGYNHVDGELQVNEHEAEIVRLIFKWSDEGMGLRKLASALNERGYKTRKGEPFTFNGVRSIRDNKMLYQGYYKYNNMDWTKGKQEAIL